MFYRIDFYIFNFIRKFNRYTIKKKGKPKAYLNYVFFDKELNFVPDGSGIKQVDGAPGELEILSSGKVVANLPTLKLRQARKNGYVYTSNESPQDDLSHSEVHGMFFDNFAVTQSATLF